MNRRVMPGITAAALGAAAVWPVFAEGTVKIGVVEAMTGPQQSAGVQTPAAAKLCKHQHGAAPRHAFVFPA